MFYSGRVRPLEGLLGDVQFLLRTVVPWSTQSGGKRTGGLVSAIYLRPAHSRPVVQFWMRLGA